MFMCEIHEWMGLIMLEWKVFNVVKTASIFMWQRHYSGRKKPNKLLNLFNWIPMCATYNHHFVIYGKDKTKVT
jgi:hypothetical protein